MHAQVHRRIENIRGIFFIHACLFLSKLAASTSSHTYCRLSNRYGRLVRTRDGWRQSTSWVWERSVPPL